jgi:hypothetical protein
MLKKSFALVLSLAMVLSLASAARVSAAPLALDANPQYFNYNGQTIALVGYSGEYLPHVRQPLQNDNYCTYDSYQACIDDLSSRGINKIRMWLGVNHSPGIALGTGAPYEYEQPFPYDSVAKKWDMSGWETVFFNRVKQVLTYAQDRNVIVEITLFDPFQGDWTKGPWYAPNNKQSIGFTTEQYFVSFDSTTTDTNPANIAARNKQVEFMKRAAFLLNGWNNFYWELANEPDISNPPNGATGAPMTNWHNYMAQQLYDYEGTLLNGRHLIAVNYHTQHALDTIKNGTANPNIKIVSGHYVDLADSTRYAAIELIRNWHGGLQGSLNKVFGFNETRITPLNTTAEGARAEAWEFMTSEGGLYDHLGYQWRYNTVAIDTRRYLGYLSSFLKSFNLRNMGRQTFNPPTWCPNLPGYGTNNTRWGAMQWSRNQFALYIHHSTISSGSFKKYDPVTGSYSHNLQLNLGTLAGNFTAEWVSPSTGLILSTTNFYWPADGSSYFLQSPTYSFDIALRIKRQGT